MEDLKVINMGKMTDKSLEEAFAGESKAHMKYMIFSEVAEREGKENVARMFKAIAYAEQVHATNHARELGKIGDTEENLQAGIDGEDFEVHWMYPAYHEIAHLEEEEGAKRSIHYALEAEKIHSKMYEKAKNAVDEGEDIELDEVYICPVCGYTHEGEPPKECPVCGVTSDKFKMFD